MKYAQTCHVYKGEKHIATFSYVKGGGYWFLTIENKLTNVWETRVYKTESATNAQITRLTKCFLRVYG